MGTSEKLDLEQQPKLRSAPDASPANGQEGEDRPWWEIRSEQVEFARAAAAQLLGPDQQDPMDAELVTSAIFVGCQAREDIWGAYQAATEPTAKRSLLQELLEAGQKCLSEEQLPGYGSVIDLRTPEPRTSAAEPMEQDSFLIRNGIPYMPLPQAVRYTGVSRDTLLNWLKNKVLFDGEPIDAIYFKPTGNHFISKPSVERIGKRFVKWPSEEPAGNVTLGPAEQGTGYVPVSEAASIAGIPQETLRKWVRLGNAPLETPLVVVKDTASGHFYIRQESVRQLAKHVQKFGVLRGRRPQLS